MHVCVCVCVFVRERERQRERESKRLQINTTLANFCITNIQQIDIPACTYNEVGIQKVSWKWDEAQRSSLKGRPSLIHIHHFLSSN